MSKATEKQKQKLLDAAGKIRARRTAYVKSITAQRQKEQAQILKESGADGVAVGVDVGPLPLDVLNEIEVLFNSPIGQINEQVRLLQVEEQRARVEALPPIIEAKQAAVDELRVQLAVIEPELKSLQREYENTKNNLEYGRERPTAYERQAFYVHDAAVNHPARQQHYDYILNY
jgi:wobble nucleotide-excising tRNase